MAANAVLVDVSAGMQAQSADGKILGTITGVSVHGVETFFEVTPAHTVAGWLHLSHHAACMYLPGDVVTSVSGTRAVLNIDASAARACTLRPSWFVGPKSANLQSW